MKLTGKSTPTAKKAGDKSQESDGAASASKASDKKEAIARAKSTVSDLELPKIAVEALQHGHDTLSITLMRKGENAELVVQSEAGILRFIGMALSKFTKDNLEDE